MQRLATIAPPQVHEIWALLSQIPDPEIPVLTITDLGMVRNVTQMGEGWVIGFTPTYSGCPATEHLIGAIREAMTTHGFTPVQVVLQLDPAWTTDWMTPDARERLRQYGISPPAGHSCHAHLPPEVRCPRCASVHTTLISEFGSTACKALYRCDSCRDLSIISNVFEDAMTTFHSLTVAKVEPETRDAVTITFAVPQPLQEAYRFRPGQHLTLKASFDGEELRRCYSICRSYLPGEISVAVKAIEGGRFSRYAREHIRQGMTLEVMVPQGHFGYQPQAERQGRYLAIAAGSGITPMLAIIATTLQTEPESQFTLIYGNRTSQSMMFRQALADLKDKYPQRLQLLCIFSQETLDSDLLHGRIDGEKLQSLGASLINFRLYDEAFICGTAAMMDETEAALKALGMPDKTIHLERFNTPGTRVKRSVNVQSDGQKVTVRQDGRDREIVLNADDESILDAALRQGADLPYACKGGVCATCKCKVLRGKVAMETNYSLEPDELAAGYVLSCQALPLTSDVVVDFDAKGMA